MTTVEQASPYPNTERLDVSELFTWHRMFGIVAPVFTVLFGYWAVRGVDASQAGAVGMVALLPPAYFATVILLGASFLYHVSRSRLDTVVLVAHVIGLIVLLHGVISWIELNPRFPVTYVHQGLTEFIQRTSHTLPTADARMSWPGFFALSAMLDKIAGVDNIFPFTLWAALFFNLAYAPLIYSIARTTGPDHRTPWLVVWLYFSVSWVGQDYYSPQALNFIFFLSFMAIVLRCFRTDRAPMPAVIRSIANFVSSIVCRVLRVDSLQPGGAPILATVSWQRAALVSALVLLYASSIVSHQLTPFFLLIEVTGLVILRKTVLRGFPMLMIVLVFSYISYGAIGFWSGHINDMFGGLGRLSGTVKDNVGSKVQVHSSHVYVIYLRLALAASVWATAIFGMVRRLRKGRTDIPSMIGFAAPFFVLGGQSYGGEAILRVFLFSLPFAAIFCVYALLPWDDVRLTSVKTLLAFVVLIGVLPAFLTARFGNEQFEYVSKYEYQAVNMLYKIATPGSELIAIDGNVAWETQDLDQFNYVIPDKLGPDYSTQKIYNAMIRVPNHKSYLFVSRSQLENIALTSGKSRDWGDSLAQQLVASGEFKVLYENPGARIFTLTHPPTTRAGGATGP